MLMNTASRTEIPINRMGYNDDAGNDIAVSQSDFFKDGTRKAYYARQFLTAARAGDTTDMNAPIAAAQAAGMKDKDIAKMVRQANDKGYIDVKLDQNAKRAWAQDLAAKYGNGFLATDFELKHWATIGANGNLGKYGNYAATQMAAGDLGVDDVKM